MELSGFQELTIPPTQDCRVVFIDKDGNVSNGNYSVIDGYDIQTKDFEATHWMGNTFSPESILTNKDHLSAFQLEDPAIEEVIFQLTGFAMVASYNMEVLKTEEDIIKMADGVSQLVYEDCVKTLLSANGVE